MKYYFWLISILFFLSCENEKKSVGQVEVDNIVSLEQWLKRDSVGFDKWEELGKLYLEEGQSKKALPFLIKAWALDSSNYELTYKVSDLAFKLVDFKTSKSFLEKCINIDSTKLKAFLDLAKMEVYLGNYNQAFQKINVVLRKDQYIPEAYYWKGVCYKHLKDTSRAISSFKTAVEVNPSLVDPFIELGLLETLKNNPNGSYYYLNALENDSTNELALYGWAWSNSQFGKDSVAFVGFDKLIRLYPNHYEGIFNLGALSSKRGDSTQARSYFFKLLEVNPRDPRVHYQLAKSFEASGNKKSAEQFYENVAALMDSNSISR